MASKKSVNKQPKFVGFVASVRNFWKQAFDFHGCTSRGQFWFVMLFLALVDTPLIILNNHGFNCCPKTTKLDPN